MKYYRGSDGVYYSEQAIWERLENGTWRVFCWDDDTGQEWFEAQGGVILCLEPVAEREVPEEDVVEQTDG
ncbi:MAG: hypothetical protein ABEJ44_06265 [Halanaeroarchaeum sp.]